MPLLDSVLGAPAKLVMSCREVRLRDVAEHVAFRLVATTSNIDVVSEVLARKLAQGDASTEPGRPLITELVERGEHILLHEDSLQNKLIPAGVRDAVEAETCCCETCCWTLPPAVWCLPRV